MSGHNLTDVQIALLLDAQIKLQNNGIDAQENIELRFKQVTKKENGRYESPEGQHEIGVQWVTDTTIIGYKPELSKDQSPYLPLLTSMGVVHTNIKENSPGYRLSNLPIFQPATLMLCELSSDFKTAFTQIYTDSANRNEANAFDQALEQTVKQIPEAKREPLASALNKLANDRTARTSENDTAANKAKAELLTKMATVLRDPNQQNSREVFTSINNNVDSIKSRVGNGLQRALGKVKEVFRKIFGKGESSKTARTVTSVFDAVVSNDGQNAPNHDANTNLAR